MHFFVSSLYLFKKLCLLLNNTNNNSNTVYFVFEIKNNKKKLTITSFSNLEKSYYINTDIHIYIKKHTEKKIIIHSKFITDILSTLTKEIICIKKEKNVLNILSFQGSFKIPIIQKKFNISKKSLLNKNNKMYILSNILLKVLNNILSYVEKIKLFQNIISGIYFHFSKNESNFFFTNNFILVKYTVKYIKFEDVKFFIPKNTVNILHNFLKYDKNHYNIKIKYNSKTIIFFLKNYSFTSKLLDNKKYKNYNFFIPKVKFDVLFIINRILFLNTIKRLFILSDKKIIKFFYLKIMNGKLSILNQNNCCSLQINCKYIFFNSLNKKIKMGFNYQFIIDILSHLKNDFIYFELYNSNKMGILKTKPNQKIKEFISILIMSIM
ncbi:DNA polymerase III subunit beta family protein [Blattabacterium cuenoti]|uniref:DNA polymerase III subunit beta family protein n=1 Tax=Blattabacterium cuenoti TaxID=1653831 RepID=UPI00163CC764|nr:DNA polymerase III subunit beta [Blattabacterium cuenoti]